MADEPWQNPIKFPGEKVSNSIVQLCIYLYI